jgi:hypothetical protein
MAVLESIASVRLIGRTLYINNDPGMPHLLPLTNVRTLQELAEEIMMACVEYDMPATWEAAKHLAVLLVKQIEKETLEGGFELGWD